jgi:hypothetical protein
MIVVIITTKARRQKTERDLMLRYKKRKSDVLCSAAVEKKENLGQIVSNETY